MRHSSSSSQDKIASLIIVARIDAARARARAAQALERA
jgi:hypothetical protein